MVSAPLVHLTSSVFSSYDHKSAPQSRHHGFFVGLLIADKILILKFIALRLTHTHRKTFSQCFPFAFHIHVMEVKVKRL